jgi:nitrogenase-stabilizing/protective protein
MDSLTQRLKALSSAEDFMAFFGIAYEERVVQVNRLHILKRFYQYLHKSTDLALGDDIELFRQYRALLQRAYGDFVHSNAATEKVFKVFQDASGQKTVSAASLRDSLASRRRGPDAPGQLAAAAGTLQQAS